jgi:hypothetical protein
MSFLANRAAYRPRSSILSQIAMSSITQLRQLSSQVALELVSAANKRAAGSCHGEPGSDLENKKKELFHKQESLSDMAGRAASHKGVLRRSLYQR